MFFSHFFHEYDILGTLGRALGMNVRRTRTHVIRPDIPYESDLYST